MNASVRNDSNIVLRARIDFERISKLTAESCYLDRQARNQEADVDTCRSADERVNLTRAVIDEDDEPKRQIIYDPVE